MQQRFLLQILLLAQHASGTTTPIIRSSRILYLVLWFSSCWSGVELRVMCPVCRTHNSQLHTRTTTSIFTSTAVNTAVMYSCAKPQSNSYPFLSSLQAKTFPVLGKIGNLIYNRLKFLLVPEE